MVRYDREASDRSKALIAYFLLVSLCVAIFSSMSFGWWWLAIVPTGMLAVSIVGGIWQAIYATIFPRTAMESLDSLPVMIGQLAIGVAGSYYALKTIHGWIH
jgi:uncharacterized membrane protein